MGKWNPFSKSKPGTVPAVPGSKGAWEPQDPGLLFQAATPVGPGPSVSAAPAKEESKGLLGGFMKKKPQPEGDVEAAAAPPPKTLKEQFKSQKGFAGIGMLLSILVLVLALFMGSTTKILNIVCGVAGFLSCLFYFFAASMNKGKTIFMYSSLACMAFGVGIFIYNLMWLISNFTNATSWLVIPFTIISMVAILAQVGIVGWLAWRSFRHSHAEKQALTMMAKAQEFARTVG